MNVPPDYHKFCGPRAVAALLGIHPSAAADRLWHTQTARGRITAPDTSGADMLLVLAAAGRNVAEFATGRDVAMLELTGHHELVAELHERFQREAAAPAQLEPDPLPSISEQAERRIVEFVQSAEAGAQVTLREFLATAGAGDWLLSMGASVKQGSLVRHAIAVRDGQVIAGDGPELPNYGPVAVNAAWRIEKTTEETRP